MFTRARLAFGLAVLAASFGLAATAAAQPLRSDAGGSATLGAQVLSQLNSIRAQRGLVPLRVAPALSAAASLHSREMTQDGYFDHDSADGSPFWKRLERFYPSGKAQFWSVGENLLWESPEIDAGAAIQMWMQSPEHRKNMLDPRWREIGISAVHVAAAPGYFKGDEVTVVTADFGVRR